MEKDGRIKKIKKLKILPIGGIALLVAVILVGAAIITFYSTYSGTQEFDLTLEGTEYYISIDGVPITADTFDITDDVFTDNKLTNGETEEFLHSVSLSSEATNDFECLWDLSAVTFLEPEHVYFGYICRILGSSGGDEITEMIVSPGATANFYIEHSLHENWMNYVTPLSFSIGMTIEEILYTQHYKLNDDATEKVNSDDGTVFGGTTWVAGKDGQCAEFDGVDGYISLPSTVADYDVGSAFSIAMWINYDDVVGIKKIWAKYDGSKGQYIEIIDDTINWCFQDGGSTWVRTTMALSHSTWYHVALTWDTIEQKIYVDGVDQALTFAGSLSGTIGNAESLTLGRSCGEYFDGKIDDVRFYSIALDGTQVLELFNSYQ